MYCKIWLGAFIGMSFLFALSLWSNVPRDCSIVAEQSHMTGYTKGVRETTNMFIARNCSTLATCLVARQ